MQSSPKQKLFSHFVFGFWKSRLDFEYFQIKVNLIADVFPKLGTLESVVK